MKNLYVRNQTDRETRWNKKKVVIELFGHSILTGLLRSSATRLFQNHTAKKSRMSFCAWSRSRVSFDL